MLAQVARVVDLPRIARLTASANQPLSRSACKEIARCDVGPNRRAAETKIRDGGTRIQHGIALHGSVCYFRFAALRVRLTARFAVRATLRAPAFAVRAVLRACFAVLRAAVLVLRVA